MVQISELSRQEASLNSYSVRIVFLRVSLCNNWGRKRESVGMKREGTGLREGKSKQDESRKGEGGREGEMKLALKKEKTR